MNHKPFDEWLFTAQELEDHQLDSLRKHIAECETCGNLTESWLEVETYLRKAHFQAPYPGFVNRFQDRWEVESKRSAQKQSVFILLFSLSAAVLLFTSLLVMVWPWLNSPHVLLWNWAYQLFTLFNYAEATREFISPVLRTITSVIPFSWWMIFVGLLSELCVMWVVSYRHLTNPRRITQ